MGQFHQKNGWIKLAELARENIKGEKRRASVLEIELTEEREFLNAMRRGLVLVGFMTLALLASSGFIPYMVQVSPGIATPLRAPVAIVLAVTLSVWAGCAPAGFMGLLRKMRDSDWFVFGTRTIGLIPLCVAIVVPVMLNPCCLMKQRERVRAIESQIEASRKRIGSLHSAISR